MCKMQHGGAHPLHVCTPEREDSPMSVGMYMQLSQVSGFKVTNGEDYNTYITRWMVRRGVADDPRSPAYDPAVALLSSTSKHALDMQTFATVRVDSRAVDTVSVAPTTVLDMNLLHNTLDNISEKYKCEGHMRHHDGNKWSSGNVTVEVNETVTDLIMWGMVLLQGAVLAPVAAQFARWVELTFHDPTVHNEALALRVGA